MFAVRKLLCKSAMKTLSLQFAELRTHLRKCPALCLCCDSAATLRLVYWNKVTVTYRNTVRLHLNKLLLIKPVNHF